MMRVMSYEADNLMEDELMELTKHGYMRIKERFGIKGDIRARRQVTLAYQRGLDKLGSSPKISAYIDSILASGENCDKKDVVVRIYDKGAYIFSKTGVLITCWQLSGDMYKKSLYAKGLGKVDKRVYEMDDMIG